MDKWYVYILEMNNGKYYIWSTTYEVQKMLIEGFENTIGDYVDLQDIIDH